MTIQLKRLDRNNHRIIGKFVIDGLTLWTKECGREFLPAGEYHLVFDKKMISLAGTGCFLISDNERQYLYGDILIGFERSFDSLSQCASAMIKVRALLNKHKDIKLIIS